MSDRLGRIKELYHLWFVAIMFVAWFFFRIYEVDISWLSGLSSAAMDDATHAALIFVLSYCAIVLQLCKSENLVAYMQLLSGVLIGVGSCVWWGVNGGVGGLIMIVGVVMLNGTHRLNEPNDKSLTSELSK